MIWLIIVIPIEYLSWAAGQTGQLDVSKLTEPSGIEQSDLRAVRAEGTAPKMVISSEATLPDPRYSKEK